MCTIITISVNSIGFISTLLAFFLISSPIFSFLFIFQHIEIRGITGFADEVLFHCFAYGTSRFMTMCSVAIFAVGGGFEYFGKIMSDLFFFHIECAEALDTRSIDDIAISFHREHFGESSSMHSFVVVRRNFAGLGCYARQYGIDKSRFDDSRMSGK